jgi:hypothetical protein
MDNAVRMPGLEIPETADPILIVKQNLINTENKIWNL